VCVYSYVSRNRTSPTSAAVRVSSLTLTVSRGRWNVHIAFMKRRVPSQVVSIVRYETGRGMQVNQYDPTLRTNPPCSFNALLSPVKYTRFKVKTPFPGKLKFINIQYDLVVHERSPSLITIANVL